MARADAGLTISELAKRAGVSRDTISNAERGQHSLQASTLNKVARALGKTPSELLAEEERLLPKAARGSSLEPSLFNDVLEEEQRADEYQHWLDFIKPLREANPEVLDWLRKYAGRFGLISDEEFIEYVHDLDLGIDDAGVPTGLVNAAQALKEEGNEIDDILFSPNRRKSLDKLLGDIYAEDLAGLSVVERAIETGQMASELRTALRAIYLRREIALINYSGRLRAAGLTRGQLMHDRMAAIEAARERALREVFSNARGA